MDRWCLSICQETASQDCDKVLSIVDRLHRPLVDMHPLLGGQSDPLAFFPIRRYAHYNEVDHKLFGEEVIRRLATL